MNSQTEDAKASFFLALVVSALSVLPSAAVNAETMLGLGKECSSIAQRPLSDFLDAQGAVGSNFFPPVPDYIGWAGGDFIFFTLVDYAGLANDTIVLEGGASLGTAFSGSILECALPDGTAKISVVLNTRNAMAFAQSIEDLANNDFDFANTPTSFGNKAVDIANGSDAALGNSSLRTSFIISAPGSALPDFFLVINDSEQYGPYTIDFRATSVGMKPDGSKVRLRVQQVCSAEKGGQQVCTRELVDLNK